MEQRPLGKTETRRLRVIDFRAGQIAGQQVRRKLYAPKTAVHGRGQRLHRGSLGQTRQTLDQDMSARQQTYHKLVEQIGLTDDGIFEIFA